MSRAAQIRPEEAKAERARRELARRHLTAFGSYIYPWWHPAAHHDLVGEALEQVELYIRSGGLNGIGRLIVEMPPRHGKTEQAAKLFPAWLLGRQPDKRVILTGYGADLAEDASSKVRDIVQSERYAAVFGAKSVVDAPVELSSDSRSRSNWDLAEPNRGGVIATGVGGGITGKGAHLLVIDDPFKNREDAESKLYREKVITWYGSSAYTRLEKGGAVVIMHTRWHREDLTGKLLKAMVTDKMADRWMVICLPALAMEPEEYATSDAIHEQGLQNGVWIDTADPLGRKPGQALWPSMYDEEALAKIKANLENTSGLRDWYSLYQQQPRPMEGAIFAAGDFQVVEQVEVPKELNWYRYVDLAISEKKSADFNATVAEALDKDGNLYLRDMIRERGWVNFKPRLMDAMKSDLEHGTQWGIEGVAFQSLVFQELLADASLASIPISKIQATDDKVTRAMPLQTRAKAGKVKLVRGPWNQEFITEALDFPVGSHDDQVDTASGGLGMISGGKSKEVKVSSNKFYQAALVS